MLFNPIGTVFNGIGLVPFSELRYFIGVKVLLSIRGETQGKYKENFTRVDIPESVSSLGRYVLGFDHSVVVVFHGKTPPSTSWSFSYTTQTYDTCTPNGCIFYVPDESLELYKEAFTKGDTPLKHTSIIHPMSEYQP